MILRESIGEGDGLRNDGADRKRTGRSDSIVFLLIERYKSLKIREMT